MMLPARVPREALSRLRFAVDNARDASLATGLAVAQRAELTRFLVPGAEPPAVWSAGSLKPLSRGECLDLLATQSVGRLAYIARQGTPDIVPVNYALDGSDIVIRSGPGPKLQAAERGDRVAFEVDLTDERTASGWSVVVHGVARRDTGGRAGDGDRGPRPWADGPRHAVIRIAASRISGRRVV